MPRPFTVENAAEMGRRGGRGRKVDLGPLETVEDAKHRLDVICQAACDGRLSGAVAGAANRSVEVWLKAIETDHTKQLVEMRKRLTELEKELRKEKVSY